MKYLCLELYKLKRRKVFLTFVLILGVELLFVFSNYGNNENFLGMISDPNAPAWEDLIVGPATMNGLFLPILAAVIASRICDMEHRGNTWKLLECNNENRKAIWFCKFTVVTVLMLAAILIQALVIVAYGNAVGIVEPLPVKTLWEFVLGTVMVTFVVVTIQVFFSLVFANQLIPMSIGMIGALIGFISTLLPTGMRRGEYQSVICPYGYRKSADGRMEPDEDVAPNVQMIFQWASEGNTAAEITRKLYAMNIPTPGEYRKLKGKDYYNVSRTNGVWSTSTVLRILEDQRYIGTYVIGKRKVKEIGSRHTQLKDESEWFKIPNHHPAIVSVDLFEKANASIKRFSLSNKKPRDYLLRGKVFCGCCDHAMSLRNGAWFYCRHSEVAETLPCHGVRIKMADLEQVVFETIRAQMCPALGIDSNKDKLDLQTVQQAEHEEKLRSIQDSKRHLYEQYALGEIDLETYRTRKAVYDTELVQAKNVHAVITAQIKQIKSDYEIKLKQQEIVQEVGNANMLTKALIDRLINKVYVFPGDRIEIEYATQDFLETKESEKEV